MTRTNAGTPLGDLMRRYWVPAALSEELAEPDGATRAESSRDWWPLAMTWALDNQVAARAAAVVRPDSAEQVASVLRYCNEARVPVTTAAGRSGVCGASVPVHGGILLDLCALAGIRGNDVLAIGAVFECQRRGWDVPGRAVAVEKAVLLGYVPAGSPMALASAAASSTFCTSISFSLSSPVL